MAKQTKNRTKSKKSSKRGNGLDGWDFLAMPNNLALNRNITRTEALNVSTVYRCIAVLTDGVSTLPAILYRKRADGGKDRANDHPLYKVLKFKPNHKQSATAFYSQIMMSLLMRGNAYVQKARSFKMQVTELGVLNPDYVTVKFDDKGELIYQYDNPVTKEKRNFTYEDLIHIRTMAQDGVMGLSPLDCAIRTTVGITIAAEEHGARFFKNGVKPSGVLEHPGKISAAAAIRLKDDFEKKNSGSEHAGTTLVLEEGMKWNQVSFTNEQSQYLQTREFQVVEVCRWFGVPPHKVAELKRATFSNIEQQSLDFVTDSLRPWLVRIEEAILLGLFEEDEWDEYTFEFLVDALLRGDTAARFVAYSTALQNGIMNIDEARAKENMNPIPDGLGQKFRVQLNMQTLGEEPPKPAANPASNGAAKPEVDPEEDAKPEDGGRMVSRIWLEQIIDRVVRRWNKMQARGNVDEKQFERESAKDLEPVFGTVLVITEKNPEKRAERTNRLVQCTIEAVKAASVAGSWGDWALEQVGKE